MKVVSFHLPFLWQLNPALLLVLWLLGTWGLCAQIWKTTTTNTCWLISSSAPEWTRQAWMGFPLVSCLMDVCTLESALMQHLNERRDPLIQRNLHLPLSQCHTSCNRVTIYKRNPLPRLRQSIDLASNTHFIAKLNWKNPPIDLIFRLVWSYQYDRTTIITPCQFLPHTFPQKI